MTSARQWAATIALAVGIFILITIEELPIGVLSVMAPDLGVSEGVGGLAVTVPGVLAGVVAMLTPVIAGGLDRRLVLVIALASVVVSCALSVIAPNFAVLLLARLFAGVSIGLYWAVLAIVAVAQMPPERASRALTVAFSGAGAALVLGVPVASWIGTHVGWRSAFAVVGVAALVVAVLLRVLVAPVRTSVPVSMGMMRRATRSRGVRHALVLTLLVITAQFITYSYVSPLLATRANVPLTRIGAMLLAFGLAGLIGNFAVGIILRRSAPMGVLVIAAGLGLALLAFLLLVRTPASALAVMPVWGLFAGAASVTIQAFVGSEARDVVEEGTALNSAAFNTSIALGALIGGRILDLAGQNAMILTSVVMIALAVGIVVRYIRRTPTHV
jgi:predicted MFS family arabinose efflux permease